MNRTKKETNSLITVNRIHLAREYLSTRRKSSPVNRLSKIFQEPGVGAPNRNGLWIRENRTGLLVDFYGSGMCDVLLSYYNSDKSFHCKNLPPHSGVKIFANTDGGFETDHRLRIGEKNRFKKYKYELFETVKKHQSYAVVRDIAVADLNNDQRMDLVMGTRAQFPRCFVPAHSYVLSKPGSSSEFERPREIRVNDGFSTPFQVFGMVLADFEHRGKKDSVDIFFAHGGNLKQGDYLVFGDGSGEFSERTGIVPMLQRQPTA